MSIGVKAEFGNVHFSPQCHIVKGFHVFQTHYKVQTFRVYTTMNKGIKNKTVVGTRGISE